MSQENEAFAGIATSETDRVLAAKYRDLGAKAAKAGEPKSSVPSGLVGKWWLEGYESPKLGSGEIFPMAAQ